VGFSRFSLSSEGVPTPVSIQILTNSSPSITLEGAILRDCVRVTRSPFRSFSGGIWYTRDLDFFLLSIMAASAADIRSALSIPEASATAGPSQPKKPAPTNTRKPEGISRELYSLIGPSAPSLAAQLIKPRLKQKPNFGGGVSKTRWYVGSKFGQTSYQSLH